MPDAMDEFFGEHPGRPTHHDFWKLSDVVLQIDGRMEAALAVNQGQEVFSKTINDIVDLECLVYMAQQRVARVLPGASTLEMGRATAIYLTAFVDGATYERNRHAQK